MGHSYKMSSAVADCLARPQPLLIDDKWMMAPGGDVCATLISKVTDAVIDEVVQRQSWLLDAIYPIINPIKNHV